MAGLVHVVHVLSVLLIACSFSVQARVEDADFFKWVSAYGIQVHNLDKIYPVWKKNFDFVHQQNSLGLSYTLSLNQYAHLTAEELVGKNPINIDRKSFSPDVNPASNNIRLPPSIDWREKGAVLPVQNQGQLDCSSAIAIIESVASFGFIVNGKLEKPSIDEYIDCCQNGSCNGGLFGIGSYKCIAKLRGLACEYPASPNHTCRSKDVKPCIVVSGGKAVPSGDEMALAESLLKQPIAVAIDASHMSFQFYKSGVYYNPDCSKTKLDHSLLLVGYGTNDHNEDYWLIQNSWGASWGMNGYMMMARNRGNTCGIATDAVYPY